MGVCACLFLNLWSACVWRVSVMYVQLCLYDHVIVLRPPMARSQSQEGLNAYVKMSGQKKENQWLEGHQLLTIGNLLLPKRLLAGIPPGGFHELPCVFIPRPASARSRQPQPPGHSIQSLRVWTWVDTNVRCRRDPPCSGIEV